MLNQGIGAMINGSCIVTEEKEYNENGAEVWAFLETRASCSSRMHYVLFRASQMVTSGLTSWFMRPRSGAGSLQFVETSPHF